MSILSYTKEIIIRDLNALKEEIKITDEDLLWHAEPGIINSVGTLCYHICGNLNHFIGNKIGHNEYIRDREAEFNKHDLSKNELVFVIDQTINCIEKVLSTEIDLEMVMPDPPPHHVGKSIGFFLIQLTCHLSRHRGQLDYLRRISKERKNSSALQITQTT
jgi:hypothetical protein